MANFPTYMQPSPYGGLQSATGMQPQQYGYQQPPVNQTFSSTPVMSIAPVSGESNAAQFPVAAGVELWLVDKSAKKIWIKSNSSNPSEMQEINFEYVAKPANQNEPVSRSEFEEMKNMMAQMMTMMQSQSPRQNQPSRKERREMRRINQDESADDANG